MAARSAAATKVVRIGDNSLLLLHTAGGGGVIFKRRTITTVEENAIDCPKLARILLPRYAVL